MTAARDGGGGAQILKSAVGAAADKDGVDGQAVQRLIRRQPHIGQHLLDLGAPPDVAQGAQVGGPAANGRHRLGTAAPCDHRLDGGGVDAHHLIVGRARIAGQGTPVGDRRLEGRASRRMGAAVQPGEGRLVRGDQAGAGARLDRHVADGHPPRHVQVADGLTGVFDDEAGRPIGADPADDRQNQILGRDPETERPLHLDQHRSGALLHQGLGRQNMFDLGGADAEGQGAEGSVGGGVAVAADDGHARQGQPLFRPDDVNDALVDAIQRNPRQAELGGVGLQLLDLRPAFGIEDSGSPVQGRNIVVGHGQGLVWRMNANAALTQALEGLGAGDFVDQMEVDIHQHVAAAEVGDLVPVVYLVQQSAGLGHRDLLSGR
ncbi:hypothetical protein ACMZ4W_02302 [Brevundimonas naejangsanensis]